MNRWTASRVAGTFFRLAVAGGCVGLVLGIIVVGVMRGTAGSDAGLGEALIGAAIGAILFVSIWVYISYESAAAEKKAEAERDRRNRAAQVKREKEVVRARAQARIESANKVVEEIPGLYRNAAHYAEGAKQSSANAEHYLRQRAFSPFWESVENSLQQLAQLRECVEGIRTCTRRYQESLSESEAISPKEVGEIQKFPEGVLTNTLDAIGARVGRDLQALVAQTHSDFQFASIYEQRRTTAAVIAGFATLEAAVNGMGATISSSIAGLQSDIKSSETAMQRLVGSVAQTSPFFVQPYSVQGQLFQINTHLKKIAS